MRFEFLKYFITALALFIYGLVTDKHIEEDDDCFYPDLLTIQLDFQQIFRWEGESLWTMPCQVWGGGVQELL